MSADVTTTNTRSSHGRTDVCRISDSAGPQTSVPDRDGSWRYCHWPGVRWHAGRREGWAQFFLRRGYAVYVVDQVGRGRSTYQPEVYGNMSSQTREYVMQRFAAGEKYNMWPQAHLHTQWPGKAE